MDFQILRLRASAETLVILRTATGRQTSVDDDGRSDSERFYARYDPGQSFLVLFLVYLIGYPAIWTY